MDNYELRITNFEVRVRLPSFIIHRSWFEIWHSFSWGVMMNVEPGTMNDEGPVARGGAPA
jgi:hypothetical protein